MASNDLDMWYSGSARAKEIQNANEQLAKAKLQEKKKLANGYKWCNMPGGVKVLRKIK